MFTNDDGPVPVCSRIAGMRRCQNDLGQWKSVADANITRTLAVSAALRMR